MNVYEPMGSSRVAEGPSGRRWSQKPPYNESVPESVQASENAAHAIQHSQQLSFALTDADRPLKQDSLADAKVVRIRSVEARPVFSLEEARQLLPVVFRLTKSYKEKVEGLIQRIDSLSCSGFAEELVARLEKDVAGLILDWQNKVRRLGAEPQGLWIADFDSGKGFFCWKYPERTISHWHGYQDGFIRRRPLD